MIAPIMALPAAMGLAASAKNQVKTKELTTKTKPIKVCAKGRTAWS